MANRYTRIFDAGGQHSRHENRIEKASLASAVTFVLDIVYLAGLSPSECWQQQQGNAGDVQGW